LVDRLSGFIPGSLYSLIEGGVGLVGVGLGGDAAWAIGYMAPGAAEGLFHVTLGLAMMLFFR